MTKRGHVKLSKLVRQGANRPQAFRDFVQEGTPKKGIATCTCVIGGAYEAVTGQLPPHKVNNDADSSAERYAGTQHVFEALHTAVGNCLNDSMIHPVTGGYHGLWFILVSLNDDYQWSKERVADWLEAQEL